MSIWDLRDSVRRCWPVLLVLIALAATVAWQVYERPGAYWASTKVVLTAPGEAGDDFVSGTNRAVLLAGVIDASINEGRSLDRLTSPDVSIIDQQIYDGWVVSQPNYGGQWADDYREATLLVQASGPTERDVESRLSVLVGEIRTTLIGLQDEVGAPEAARVVATVTPADTQTYYAVGRNKIAAVGVAAIGCVIALGVTHALDRVRQRRVATRRLAHRG